MTNLARELKVYKSLEGLFSRMQVYLNNILNNPGQLTMPTMNYGQGRAATNWFNYRIEVELGEFREQVSKIYDQLVEDEQNDEFAQPGEYPDMDKLKALGYPSIQELAEVYPDLLEVLIKEWMEMEILTKLTKSAQPPYYWINSLENVRVDLTVHPPLIGLEGKAYQAN